MDRVVVVTGAGAGLGRALVAEAGRRGDLVAAIGRDPAALATAGASLAPERFLPLVADVADWAAMADAFDRLLARFGRVDALFANAAVYPRRSLLDQPAAEWLHTLAVNVGGVAAACRLALPPMLAAARGRILVVGSFADVAPIADSSAYAASKGALHALTRAIAVEVGADYPDILVNEWVPGALRTAMGVADGIDPAVAAGWGLDLLDQRAGGPTGRIFERDRLVEPPRSLKRRIADRLLRRS